MVTRLPSIPGEWLEEIDGQEQNRLPKTSARAFL